MEIYQTEVCNEEENSEAYRAILSRSNRLEQSQENACVPVTELNAEQRIAESLEQLNQRLGCIEQTLLPPKKLQSPQKYLMPLKKLVETLNQFQNGMSYEGVFWLQNELIKIYNSFSKFSGYDVN